MNPVHRLHRLASAIHDCLPHRGDRERPGPLIALALIAAFGCATPAKAVNTYVVTTAGDPGPSGTLSLRQAVAAANAAAGSNVADNVVQFDPSLVGSTITLTSGEIPIDHTLTVAGPGTDKIVVSGNDASRIFHVMDAYAFIGGLTLTKGNSDSFGGAVRVDYASLTLSNVVVSESSADYGGGLGVFGGNAYIENILGSRFIGNSATVSGGAIFIQDSQIVSINRSTISGNTAGQYGGGVMVETALSVGMQQSTVSHNTAAYGGSPYGGGGIALHDVHHGTLDNSTVAQNFATEGGGGIDLENNGESSIYLFSSTVAGNSTNDGSGNGIFTDSTVNILSSIIANNSSRGGYDDLTGTFASYFSLIRAPGSAVITGTGNQFGADPELGPLDDNGGPTQTMLPAIGSPALDSASMQNGVDQRGLPRITPASPNPDIGAVERQYPEVVVLRDGFDSQ